MYVWHTIPADNCLWGLQHHALPPHPYTLSNTNPRKSLTVTRLQNLVLTPFLKGAAEWNVRNINLVTLATLNFKKKTTLGPANEEATIANKKRSIKMMISLVVVFTVCWLPWHIFQTLINWLWNDLIRYWKHIYSICNY